MNVLQQGENKTKEVIERFTVAIVQEPFHYEQFRTDSIFTIHSFSENR